MIKVLVYSLMLFVFITGCGPQFYLPANQGKPAQIVVYRRIKVSRPRSW